MDTPAKRPSSELGAPPARKGWRRFSSRLGSSFGLYGGTSLIVGYLSIIVLIPIAAVAAHGFSFTINTQGWGAAFWHWHFSAGFGTFWHDITQSAAISAIRLSLWLSLSVAAINAVMGVAIAWVLVRDKFPGKWFLEAFIDLPFALPTIVVGVVLLFLYGTDSPIKIDLFETWMGLMVALLFVTLPFSVRAVQPVLARWTARPRRRRSHSARADSGRSSGSSSPRSGRPSSAVSDWPSHARLASSGRSR
jgi:sulfate transport system permease protein